MHTIYRIVCFQNGKVYVGKTQDYSRRKTHHLTTLRNKTHHNIHLQRSFDKYGEGSFYFEILETNISNDDINQREKHWIKHFEAFTKGFNRTQGGEGKPDVGIECEWNGVKYNTISDAARALNIHVTSMRYRIDKGWTSDNDFLSKHRYNRKPITWNGVEYPSRVEAERLLGLPEGYLTWRISQGYTSDNDLKAPSPLPPKSILWNGVLYNSIGQAAKALGVDKQTVRRRLQAGYFCDADIVDRWGNKRYE